MRGDDAHVVCGQLDQSHVSSSGPRESDVLRRHADQPMQVVSGLIDCNLLHVLGLVPRSVEFNTILQNDDDFLQVDADGTDGSLDANRGDRLLLDDLPQEDLMNICEND